MKKSYWVMKTPGSTMEWVKMNGKQFYEFINSPLGSGRHFVDLGTCKIECSLEQYLDWKREQNHSSYLFGFEDAAAVLSLDYWLGLISDDEEVSLYDTIADPSHNTEADALSSIYLQLLAEAFKSLEGDERRLIEDLFLSDKPKTEQEIAVLYGVSKQYINKQKKKNLEKLKTLVVKSKKSKQ